MEYKGERCFLHDVYDENGCLLIPKNAVVTESFERMLRRRNISFKAAEKTEEKLEEEPPAEVRYFLHDICDRNGQLLVPKGTVVTQNIVDLLHIRHISYNIGNKSALDAKPVAVPDRDVFDLLAEESPSDKVAIPVIALQRKNITDIRRNISNVAIRMPQIDYHSLMDASGVASELLHVGKNEMWGLHVNSLANCVDWIYSHSINVSIIALMLAKKLNFSKKRLYDVGVAALLHDIGMVIVPDDVLNSQGQLSQEDKKLMREHPRIGYKMLLNTRLPEDVLLGVLQHHEKIDGQGYPAALPGDQIGTIARMIRIVDTFDSMTSDRPHRPAHSVQETLEMMKMEEKACFDKLIFNEFLRLFRIEQ